MLFTRMLPYDSHDCTLLVFPLLYMHECHAVRPSRLIGCVHRYEAYIVRRSSKSLLIATPHPEQVGFPLLVIISYKMNQLTVHWLDTYPASLSTQLYIRPITHDCSSAYLESRYERNGIDSADGLKRCPSSGCTPKHCGSGKGIFHPPLTTPASNP